jgi:hypothetical protein
MKDNIAITVQTANGKFRRVYIIETEFGGYDEINGKVNQIVNREFPVIGTVITSSWSYV